MKARDEAVGGRCEESRWRTHRAEPLALFALAACPPRELTLANPAPTVVALLCLLLIAATLGMHARRGDRRRKRDARRADGADEFLRHGAAPGADASSFEHDSHSHHHHAHHGVHDAGAPHSHHAHLDHGHHAGGADFSGGHAGGGHHSCAAPSGGDHGGHH